MIFSTINTKTQSYALSFVQHHTLYKFKPYSLDRSYREKKQKAKKWRRRIKMATRSSLIRFAFVCIVLAMFIMTAESHKGGSHGPAKAPSHAPAPAPMGHHTPAPAPSAATFSAYPQLIATALVGALSFVF